MTHMIFRTVWWKRAWQNHRAGEPASDIHHDVSHITHTHFSQVLKVLKENTITDTETCSCYISSHLIPIPELCVSADITAVYDSPCVDVSESLLAWLRLNPLKHELIQRTPGSSIHHWGEVQHTARCWEGPVHIRVHQHRYQHFRQYQRHFLMVVSVSEQSKWSLDRNSDTCWTLLTRYVSLNISNPETNRSVYISDCLVEHWGTSSVLSRKYSERV